ncbi:tRNA pseudouridine synthase 1 [Glugoides intestinalis]
MKRKIGMIIGYNGEGYHGLQFNGDMRTIEKDVIDILLKNNCVTELNSKDPQKMDLKSCSRTDKGVHASFNMINVKINQEPTVELFEVLKRDFEKAGLQLYKILKLPKRFIGYKAARSRIYKYIVPTYFLKESNFEGEWKELQMKDKEKGEEIHSECIEDKTKMARTYTPEDMNPLYGYKADSLEIFTDMMKSYLGTKNYHNFTVKSIEGDVKRHMKDIGVSEPFYKDEIEYVEVKIHGQSFLLHQIRKMISFSVLNSRYSRKNYKNNFEKALSVEEVHIPKCPSQYLFLHHVFFEDFNAKRAGESGDEISVDDKERKLFEIERIYPSMLKKENIYEWFKYLDAVRFHNDRFEVFKKE